MMIHTDKTKNNEHHVDSTSLSSTTETSENSINFSDNRPSAITQRRIQSGIYNRAKNIHPIQRLEFDKENDVHNPFNPIQREKSNAALPSNLKTGIENLSGYAMDDVHVHYNSGKPATLQAHAYAQGTDIHLGPGQEKHLPHEAWHVVQQKQGRVKPTMQMKGKVHINDDERLEREADVMGAKAVQLKHTSSEISAPNLKSNSNTIQLNDARGSQQKKRDMSNYLQAGGAAPPAKELSEEDQIQIQTLIVASKLLRNEAETVSITLKDGHQLDDVETLIKIGVGLGFVKVGIALAGVAADAASFGTLGEVFTWSGKAVGGGKDMLDAHIKDRLESSTEGATNKSKTTIDALKSEIQDVAEEQTQGIKEQVITSFGDVDGVKEEIQEKGVEILGQEAIDHLVPIVYSLKELFVGIKETYKTYKEQRQALGEAAVSNIQTSVETLTKLYVNISDVKVKLESPYFKPILTKVDSLESNMKKALDELIELAVKFQKMRSSTKLEEVDWDGFETRPRSEKDVSQIRDEAFERVKNEVSNPEFTGETTTANMRRLGKI